MMGLLISIMISIATVVCLTNDGQNAPYLF